ncbi:hypothetical protein O181_114925 [Austropuccinia psidii MF-1]|uniref:Uncharacterized protein n=1 Tax=Austropuccinia psidii MF-1 TaxID=1389203 RepID=A0A9Q3PVZ3_9BASI|nr:hypothetical protein [Austropuccinia psidii MF-1]
MILISGVLKTSNRFKAIYPPIKIQISNHKLFTQITGELENTVEFRCSKNCTLDDIANTLKDVRKRTNIGKYFPYRGNILRDKHPSSVENKYKPRENGRSDYPKEDKNIYAIGKAPEEEYQEGDYEFDVMGNVIRENTDDDQDTIEELPVEYQEETQLEI